MSRGLGRIQLQILEELAQAEVPRSVICWAVAERDPTAIAAGRLVPSWYSAFARAVKTLVRRNQIVASKRRLRSVDEVCAWFPSKTRDVGIRELRRALLAPLLELAHPEFDDVENETFRVRTLVGANPAAAEGMRSAWSEIEFHCLFTKPPACEPSVLIRFLARGRELFAGDTDLVSRTSFRRVAAALAAALPVELAARLTELRCMALGDEAMSELALKSRIASVVNFGRNVARPSLKDDAKGQLLILRPDLIRGLPGHRDPVRLARGEVDWRTGPMQTEFSPLLDSLLDRHVLSSFEFLRRAS